MICNLRHRYGTNPLVTKYDTNRFQPKLFQCNIIIWHYRIIWPVWSKSRITVNDSYLLNAYKRYSQWNIRPVDLFNYDRQYLLDCHSYGIKIISYLGLTCDIWCKAWATTVFPVVLTIFEAIGLLSCPLCRVNFDVSFNWLYYATKESDAVSYQTTTIFSTFRNNIWIRWIQWARFYRALWSIYIHIYITRLLCRHIS